MTVFHEDCDVKKNKFHIPSDKAKALYYYIQWVGYFSCLESFRICREGLPSYLILYTSEGCGKLIYHGREFLLSPGSTAFLDCRLLHEYFPTMHPWRFKFLHFYGSDSAAFCHHISSADGSAVFMPAESPEPFLDALFEMTGCADEADCSQKIYALLLLLSRQCPENPKPPFIKEALRYIAENGDRTVSAAALADHVHFSRCYFSSKFKEYTGLSPSRYIDRYRMERARQLLTLSSDSVESIAAKCGYGDPSSFIRAFKKSEGLSPLAFRKNK